MPDSVRPRVFVSSVMEGFQEERMAARRGIDRAGGEPVLIEDYPSLADSSRTACLDAVASCDAFLIILGSRGGWTTPSGKLVIEEEYDEARHRNLPIVYLRMQGARDDAAAQLDKKLSDYVHGHYRRGFSTVAELESGVTEALSQLIPGLGGSGSVRTGLIDERIKRGSSSTQGAHLQVVVTPERSANMFSELQLGEVQFRRALVEIARRQEVDLLAFDEGVQIQVQASGQGISLVRPARGVLLRDVRIEVGRDGTIEARISVTGRSDSESASLLSGMAILSASVRVALHRGLAFAKGVYDTYDAYHRYARVFWNAALHHQGMSPLLDAPPTGGFTMPQHVPRPAIAFSEPQLVTRQALADVEARATEALQLLHRRFQVTPNRSM